MSTGLAIALSFIVAILTGILTGILTLLWKIALDFERIAASINARKP